MSKSRQDTWRQYVPNKVKKPRITRMQPYESKVDFNITTADTTAPTTTATTTTTVVSTDDAPKATKALQFTQTQDPSIRHKPRQKKQNQYGDGNIAGSVDLHSTTTTSGNSSSLFAPVNDDWFSFSLGDALDQFQPKRK